MEHGFFIFVVVVVLRLRGRREYLGFFSGLLFALFDGLRSDAGGVGIGNGVGLCLLELLVLLALLLFLGGFGLDGVFEVFVIFVFVVLVVLVVVVLVLVHGELRYFLAF